MTTTVQARRVELRRVENALYEVYDCNQDFRTKEQVLTLLGWIGCAPESLVQAQDLLDRMVRHGLVRVQPAGTFPAHAAETVTPPAYPDVPAGAIPCWTTELTGRKAALMAEIERTP